MLDAGHYGKYNQSPAVKTYYESETMWKLHLLLKVALEKYGFVVRTTRSNAALDRDVYERGKAAKGYDVLLSLHSNAVGSGVNENTDYPVAYVPLNKKGDKLGTALITEVEKLMGTKQKGRIATREGSGGTDYYGVIRGAVAVGVVGIIIEHSFHTQTAATNWLLSDTNLQRLAESEAAVIAQYYGVSTPIQGTAIINKPTTAVEKMMQWAKNKGAKPFFVELANLFYSVSVSAGIDPTIVYCQSAKETGYGKFGGVLDESYCNPCGMKNSSGGGDYDPTAHKKFDSWEQGIKAQVDHLALYAGANGYPRVNTNDPRHFPYLFGTAKTVEELGGKWAPSKTYGEDIVKMMNEVKNTIVEQPTNLPSDWAKEAWDWAIKNKITDGTNPQGTPTREQVVQLIYNAMKKADKA